MIEIIRRFSQGTIAKIFIFGLLIISFGMWGIADYISPSSSNDTVAWVDGDPIYYNDFSRYLTQQKRQLNLLNIPDDEFKRLGLERLFLNNMIEERLLSLLATDMNIQVSDKFLVNTIQNQADFLDDDDQFSFEKYNNFLTINNINEQQYLDYLRTSQPVTWLRQAIQQAGHYDLQAINKHIVNFRSEQKDVAYLILNINTDTATVEEPNQNILSQYYDKHKNNYTLPETRDISYIEWDANSIANNIIINDDELRMYYDEYLDNFITPFSINFTQYNANSKEEAENIYNALKNNETADIATLYPDSTISVVNNASLESLQDIGLDHLEQANIGLNTPNESLFGWVVINVTAKQEHTTQSFNDVRDVINKELALEQAIDFIQEQRIALEDAIASGELLQDIAAQFNVTITQQSNIDAAGRILNSADNISIASRYPNIMQQIFAYTQGDEFILLEETDTSIIAVEIQNINPSYIPELQTIRDEVIKNWVEQQRIDNLYNMVTNATQSATDINEVALSFSKKVKHTTLSRYDAEHNQQILDGHSGYFIFSNDNEPFAIGQHGATIIVAQTSQSTISDDILVQYDTQVKNELDSLMRQYTVQEVFNRLREYFDVKINSDIL